MTDSEKTSGLSVERKLRLAWKRERRFHATRGICHLLLWAAGLGLADFFVDWYFLLPGYGRMALLVLNIATLAVVFYRAWWRHLEAYDPVRIALQVERRHPDLKSLLVSYIQFGDAGGRLENMSTELIAAARRLAVAATAPMDFREIVNWGDLRRVSLFSVAVVVCCGGLSLNWPEFFSTLFYRLLNPTASTAYPTRTHIAEITGPVTVPQGSSVTLAVRGDGLIPASGTLYIKPQEGQWERLLMPPAQDRRFAYTFDQVQRSFSYRVRLGDATSETYEVRTIPAPHVVQTRARLHYPDYTHLKDKEVETLHLEVPEGTQVSVELVCDLALKAAEVLTEGTKAAPLVLGPDGRTATVAWTVTESFPFHFRWTEREHGFVFESDVTYFVRVVPDSAPEVEIVTPTEDDKATLNKKLAIRYRAADDYGIAKATILYTLNDGAEQTRPIGTFDKSPVEEQVLWVLRDTIPGLKEGDTLTFAVEVADNHAGQAGPNVSRSRPLRLDIVSVPEYLRYVFEKRERLRKEIEAMHEEEAGASKEVKTLQAEPMPVLPAVPGTAPAPTPGTAPPPAPATPAAPATK